MYIKEEHLRHYPTKAHLTLKNKHKIGKQRNKQGGGKERKQGGVDKL